MGILDNYLPEEYRDNDNSNNDNNNKIPDELFESALEKSKLEVEESNENNNLIRDYFDFSDIKDRREKEKVYKKNKRERAYKYERNLMKKEYLEKKRELVGSFLVSLNEDDREKYRPVVMKVTNEFDKEILENYLNREIFNRKISIENKFRDSLYICEQLLNEIRGRIS